MRYAIAGIGFVAFTAVSLLHFLSLDRVAAFHGPNVHLLAAVALGLLWSVFLGLLVRGMYRNELRLPFGLVFAYGMVALVAGMAVIPGVPAAMGEGKWHDPANLLTPETKFLIHNHSVVKKVLSKEEYELHLSYVLTYFSGAGMIFCTAVCLIPLDRNGQLVPQRRTAGWTVLNRSHFRPWTMTAFSCPACHADVTVTDGEHPPRWCPQCGADL